MLDFYLQKWQGHVFQCNSLKIIALVNFCEIEVNVSPQKMDALSKWTPYLLPKQEMSLVGPHADESNIH